MPKKAIRKDGRLQAQVYLGTENGKRKYKYVYAENNRELRQKVQDLKTKLGKGIDLTADRDTFRFWADKWLKLKKAEVSAGRYTTYKARCKNLEPLYNTPISRIKAVDVQELIFDCSAKVQERTKKLYSRYTLTEIKNVAAQIFQLAIDNRVIEFNPAKTVKIPKYSPTAEKRRALTQEEQRWILDTPHRAQTAAMIMMYAGLRRGELLALTWADIDLQEKTIAVNKSVEIINGKSYVKSGGKTENAERTIYIPKILADYLRNVPGEHFGFVCASAKGTLMNDIAWRRMWDSYLTDLNLKYGDWKNCLQTKGTRPSKFAPTEKPFIIPRITAHWLRHTYITMLYMAGVDIFTAKEQAGHADIKTTMEIYTHLDDVYKKKKINKLDNYLKKLAT